MKFLRLMQLFFLMCFSSTREACGEVHRLNTLCRCQTPLASCANHEQAREGKERASFCWELRVRSFPIAWPAQPLHHLCTWMRSSLPTAELPGPACDATASSGSRPGKV